MLRTIKQFRKARSITALGIATLATGLGLAMVAPAGSAAAVTCRVYTAAQNLYEAGSKTSQGTYIVPGTSVSGCKDINVRNIKNQNKAGDYCATFRVQMFPTWGDPFYTSPKTVCSKDPDGSGPGNGPVMPIATNVLNGTEYRIWYNIEGVTSGGIPWTHTFQTVD